MTCRNVMTHFCRIAAIVCIGVFVLSGVSAPLKDLIVVCSSDELAAIQERYGAAIIEAIPAANAYLIAVPSHINLEQVQAAGNGTLASQNIDLDMQDAFSGSEFDSDLSWDSVPFYSSMAPRFYTRQAASQQIEALDAHFFSTGQRSVVAIIDTGIADHPVLRTS